MACTRFDRQDPCVIAMQDAVGDAYRAFRRYPAPAFPLDVCLSCCVPDDVEKALREWPLERLTAKQFWDYNTSAKSEIQNAREVGHFVPRMLELLAEGEEIHHSLEISLDRLGRCPDGSWNEAERAALDRFASAYFAAVLSGPLAFRWFDDPMSVLLMFHIGGLSIEPLLQAWLDCEHPSSTIQYVRATYWDFWSEQRYINAFADDQPAFSERLGQWLLDPECRRRFAARLMSAEFLEQASRQEATGCTPFGSMVDAVFDHLTA